MEPNGKTFVDHLNVLDCSKVSDAACAIAILSEEGLAKCGISKKDAVEVVQEMTHSFNGKIDKVMALKEKDVMTV